MGQEGRVERAEAWSSQVLPGPPVVPIHHLICPFVCPSAHPRLWRFPPCGAVRDQINTVDSTWPRVGDAGPLFPLQLPQPPVWAGVLQASAEEVDPRTGLQGDGCLSSG